MYKVKKTTHAHIAELAETMCADDKWEMEQFGWSSPYAALLASFSKSQRMCTVTHNGDVVCIFGCVRVGHYGVVWLLSVGFEKHRMRLARWVGPLLKLVSKGCLEVGNVVPEFQTKHLRWMRRLGFRDDEKVDVNGIPCIHMRRDQNV